MSNLLERAIIDATALKEAALKNAEKLVIEKYSDEVKQAMSSLLEAPGEDELAMDDLFGDSAEEQDVDQATEPEMGEVAIDADSIEADIPDAFMSDDEEIISIKLDSLDAELEDDTERAMDGQIDDDEISIDIEDDEPVADVTDIETAPSFEAEPAATDVGVDISPAMVAEVLNEMGLDEEVDLEDLMEKVRVDFEPQKSGWAGTPESVMREYEQMLLAREQDTKVKEENEELRKTVAALQKENKILGSAATKQKAQIEKYSTAFKTLQEKLETLNVSNAKLLYINQALENASLNERQRKKVVEAISKAATVQEAKIVFETLNETVTSSQVDRKEATLSEMVSRKSSLLVAARKEQNGKEANPLFNRMQRLAGIKTT
jgi:hypothetical protein|tara:strand:+ start:1398 stop:2528 length:1131 start_codon:yes stop_codon:yes gene_type:complete